MRFRSTERYCADIEAIWTPKVMTNVEVRGHHPDRTTDDREPTGFVRKAAE
jgi:alpha-acetolactate decarboxylase